MTRPANLTSLPVVVPSPNSPPHEPLSQRGIADESLRFRIEGMTCAGCAASLQKVLEDREDVLTASVHFPSATAVVEGHNLDPKAIVRSIENRGYAAIWLSEQESSDERSDIEKQQKENERIWRHRAIVGVGLWAPLELVHWIASAVHWHGSWMHALMFTGALIILIFAGSEFYRSAWKAAVRGTTNMDTLISLGATTAFVYSSIVWWMGLEQAIYFAEAAGLLGIVSLGHWFEARASASAGTAVRELLNLQPETAELLQEDGTTRSVRSRDVPKNCKLLVRPGGRIAVDGIVVDGFSAVDESIVSGESIPIEKRIGDTLVAGSINTTGRLILQTTVDGQHTTIGRIASLVQRAQTSRAPIQRLADRIASVFVPLVLAIAALTVFGWWLAGDLPTGIIAAVTVLIISCPCALGLATPMAVMVGTGAASKRGILIKTAEAMERIGRSRHIVFDKTGTLTVGQPQVTAIEPQTGYTQERLLQLAASVEAPSEHPIAKAIVRAANARGLPLLPVSEFQAIPGRGVQGRVEGHSIVVDRDAQATSRVVVDDVLIGTLSLADQLRSDAKAAVAALQQKGIRVSMLSGDRTSVAEGIARELRIAPSDTIANASPESKASQIQSLGDEVIMVGDGINDAAALAASGLGVALASGTNVAIEAAAVVIPGDRVQAIPELVHLSQATLKAIRQNLFFAFFYNGLAIPLAALGLLGHSGPLWAALAMGASDITVVGNALRLKRMIERERKRDN